jgi:hypothetical protein
MFEASFDAIAHHSTANLAGHRNPDARWLIIITGTRLNNKGRNMRPFASLCSLIICAPCKLVQRCPGEGTRCVKGLICLVLAAHTSTQLAGVELLRAQTLATARTTRSQYLTATFGGQA